jgi:DNA-binding HxlR family transcriptional regulator
MEMQGPQHICLCPLKGIIGVIGKKWSMLIVNAIGNHKLLRFNEIMEELKISPRTLTDTLKELESYELIKRESFNEIPPRVEYTLTDKGANLREAVIPLLKWASSTTDENNFESCCKTDNNNNQVSRMIQVKRKK